jgi:hypothetical protein
MLRAARELLAVRSPLDAELMVSELLGTWWGQRTGRSGPRNVRQQRADIEELVGEGLVAYAASQGSPAALALLSGIACLGTSRQAVQAERAALALMERGVARPAWAEHVGAVEAAECYLNSDVYGDRDEVICVFSYAGQEQHGLVVVVDYSAGGLVRDGWVTSQVGKLLEYCGEASAPRGTGAGDAGARAAGADAAAGRGAAAKPQGGQQRSRGSRPADRGRAGGRERLKGATADPAMQTTFAQVDPPHARRLLQTALAATESAAAPPVSESFPSYHAFIRARVRTLPPALAKGAASLPPPAASAAFVASSRRPLWRKDRRAMLVAEFLASDEAEDLSDREAASRCADHIVEYGCDHDFGRPLRMSPAKVDTFLLDWLPRKVMLSRPEQEAMPHVVAAWVRWAGKRTDLCKAAIARTLDAVFECMRTFTEVYRDPTSFGLDPDIVRRLLPDRDLEALPRRAFAFPLLRGTYRGTDLAGLDPAEPGDRRTLLAAYHDEPPGRRLSEEHLDAHLRLADRLWRGEPPELWEAAQRLLDHGETRHAVLHVLMKRIGEAGDSEDDLAAALAELGDQPREQPG